MIKAVTNKDFPMLKEALHNIFGIELEHDPSLNSLSRVSVSGILHIMKIPQDPEGRIRIIFIDNTTDLACGMVKDTDIIGFNILKKKIVFVGVPSEVEAISPDCSYIPRTLEGYLLSVTFHELYENITGDTQHCRNPGKCINSICRLYENGTCCVCMGGLIDDKYPYVSLEDLFCEEDLRLLRNALSSKTP